ncbi:MAG: hypothetical protein ACYDEN_08350, partial [Acidimicrobiales bacterium]
MTERTGNHSAAFPDVSQVVAEAEKAVRDGAYVAVGLGVLAFQRAQVQRRQVVKELERRRGELRDGTSAQLSARLDELARSLSANADATRAQLQELARSWDEALAPTRRRLDERADALQAR